MCILVWIVLWDNLSYIWFHHIHHGRLIIGEAFMYNKEYIVLWLVDTLVLNVYRVYNESEFGVSIYTCALHPGVDSFLFIIIFKAWDEE